jgi:hypothetical protein
VRGELGLGRRGPPGEGVRAALAGVVDEDAAQVAGRQVRGEEARPAIKNDKSENRVSRLGAVFILSPKNRSNQLVLPHHLS